MKTIVLLLALILPIAAGPKHHHPAYDLREGDIVFQGNAGPQSDAIRKATGSPYTHCGVVTEINGRLAVLEAVQPVRISPIDDFIRRSLPGTFHARRLSSPLNQERVGQARNWVEKQTGKAYDLKFAWGDDQLYCSELVWKLFHAGGVDLCKTRRFRDYNLNDPVVKRIITERYGSIEKLPRDEPVVSPGDLAA
ncbi:MAG: hypothetical protein KDL87_17695, partial [Verrucomicrobiae bacterium]|nr:hypothetical protein [Verrucomicrobiae bacterium]